MTWGGVCWTPRTFAISYLANFSRFLWSLKLYWLTGVIVPSVFMMCHVDLMVSSILRAWLIFSSVFSFAFSFVGVMICSCSASGCPLMLIVNCLFHPNGLRWVSILAALALASICFSMSSA